MTQKERLVFEEHCECEENTSLQESKENDIPSSINSRIPNNEQQFNTKRRVHMAIENRYKQFIIPLISLIYSILLLFCNMFHLQINSHIYQIFIPLIAFKFTFYLKNISLYSNVIDKNNIRNSLLTIYMKGLQSAFYFIQDLAVYFFVFVASQKLFILVF